MSVVHVRNGDVTDGAEGFDWLFDSQLNFKSTKRTVQCHIVEIFCKILFIINPLHNAQQLSKTLNIEHNKTTAEHKHHRGQTEQ